MCVSIDRCFKGSDRILLLAQHKPAIGDPGLNIGVHFGILAQVRLVGVDGCLAVTKLLISSGQQKVSVGCANLSRVAHGCGSFVHFVFENCPGEELGERLHCLLGPPTIEMRLSKPRKRNLLLLGFQLV